MIWWMDAWKIYQTSLPSIFSLVHVPASNSSGSSATHTQTHLLSTMMNTRHILFYRAVNWTIAICNNPCWIGHVAENLSNLWPKSMWIKWKPLPQSTDAETMDNERIEMRMFGRRERAGRRRFIVSVYVSIRKFLMPSPHSNRRMSNVEETRNLCATQSKWKCENTENNN